VLLLASPACSGRSADGGESESESESEAEPAREQGVAELCAILMECVRVPEDWWEDADDCERDWLTDYCADGLDALDDYLACMRKGMERYRRDGDCDAFGSEDTRCFTPTGCGP
jgi:hypothetical protein